jgi:RNA polymerase sigma factor (sigma-70 family)
MSGRARVKDDNAVVADEDLIEKFYLCSTEAGDELERRYRNRFVLALTNYNFMRQEVPKKLPSMAGRLQTAQNIVGDTIAVLVAGKGRPSKRWMRGKGAKVSTWLATILNNKAATFVRSGPQPEPPPPEKEDAENPSSLLEYLASTLERTEDDWSLAMLQALRECVAELPKEDQLQRIIELKSQERKQTEIAKELGISEATVSRRTEEARQQLRACLERKGFGIPPPRTNR